MHFIWLFYNVTFVKRSGCRRNGKGKWPDKMTADNERFLI